MVASRFVDCLYFVTLKLVVACLTFDYFNATVGYCCNIVTFRFFMVVKFITLGCICLIAFI